MNAAPVVLVNPNLVYQRNDPFTTGIVYMPVGLAYFAGALRRDLGDPAVIDAFGERPGQWFTRKNLVFRGLTPAETASRVTEGARVAVVYAINLTYHASVLEIIRRLRAARPDLAIVVMENTQAVTAYAIHAVRREFFDAGATHVMSGEAERRGVALIRSILDGEPAETAAAVGGIAVMAGGAERFEPNASEPVDLDTVPFPAWELFPLASYWKLKYSHAPLSAERYLPILTSRGCPYPCRFCVIPETNSRKWRGRSPKHVVDEMAYLKERFGVTEFHIEDVDPTVNDERTRALCREMIDRKLNVRWKIGSGTKVETIKSLDTLRLMADAGCVYLSISPESGSPKVMKLINKPFNLEHAKTIIAEASRLGIHTQACFVLGFPGEEDEDRALSLEMVRALSRRGIDEIAVFVVTPVPGSAIFSEFSGYESYSELTFSPAWRRDFAALNVWRLRLYRTFLQDKLRYHPLRILKQPLKFLARRFDTKMEMTPYRALHLTLMRLGLAGRRVSYEFFH